MNLNAGIINKLIKMYLRLSLSGRCSELIKIYKISSNQLLVRDQKS